MQGGKHTCRGKRHDRLLQKQIASWQFENAKHTKLPSRQSTGTPPGVGLGMRPPNVFDNAAPPTD
jgi:hypothetical protein